MNPSEHFFQQVFENSLQPSIIFIKDGSIVNANRAACRLLGYSKKELLTKSRRGVLNINNKSFHFTSKQKNAGQLATSFGVAINHIGNPIQCEITYSVFSNISDTKYWITAISDRSKSILIQKSIDYKKEKKVEENIFLAKTRQKDIDIKNKKIVAENILLVKSKQKSIDAINIKKVAENILIARTKQKNLDIKNKKIVADNILVIKSRQRNKDATNQRKVADDIILAKSIQKNIDVINQKITANNILTAKSLQRDVDAIKEKIVSDNIIIALAKSDARNAESAKWIKNLGETRDTERLEIGKHLHENVNQLLCASSLYIDLAKKGGKESKLLLNNSSDYMVMAMEEITKLTKMLAYS